MLSGKSNPFSFFIYAFERQKKESWDASPTKMTENKNPANDTTVCDNLNLKFFPRELVQKNTHTNFHKVKLYCSISPEPTISETHSENSALLTLKSPSHLDASFFSSNFFLQGSNLGSFLLNPVVSIAWILLNMQVIFNGDNTRTKCTSKQYKS